jgi:hypothetical protein
MDALGFRLGALCACSQFHESGGCVGLSLIGRSISRHRRVVTSRLLLRVRVPLSRQPLLRWSVQGAGLHALFASCSEQCSCRPSVGGRCFAPSHRSPASRSFSLQAGGACHLLVRAMNSPSFPSHCPSTRCAVHRGGTALGAWCTSLPATRVLEVDTVPPLARPPPTARACARRGSTHWRAPRPVPHARAGLSGPSRACPRLRARGSAPLGMWASRVVFVVGLPSFDTHTYVKT